MRQHERLIVHTILIDGKEVKHGQGVFAKLYQKLEDEIGRQVTCEADTLYMNLNDTQRNKTGQSGQTNKHMSTDSDIAIDCHRNTQQLSS